MVSEYLKGFIWATGMTQEDKRLLTQWFGDLRAVPEWGQFSETQTETAP
jgi:hypothetical protein